MKMKDNLEIRFYTKEEIEKLLDNKDQRLVYIDNGIDEVVGRFDDLPDIIVDFNRKFGDMNLRIYEFDPPYSIPIITTLGEFLDKSRLKDKMLIIDRLIKLQNYEEPIKSYKLIDEDVLAEYLRDKELER